MWLAFSVTVFLLRTLRLADMDAAMHAAMHATTWIQMAARRGEKGGKESWWEKRGKEEGEATSEFNLLLTARTLTSLYMKCFFMFFASTF